MKVVENYEILVLDNSDIKGFKKANKIEVKVSIDRGKQNTSGSTSIFYCIRASLPQILERVRDYALMNPECHNAKVTFEISNDKGDELRFPEEIYAFNRDLMTVLSAEYEEQIELIFVFKNCDYKIVAIMSMANDATYVFDNCNIFELDSCWSSPSIILKNTNVTFTDFIHSRISLSLRDSKIIDRTNIGFCDIEIDCESDISNLYIRQSEVNIAASKNCKVTNIDSKRSVLRCSAHVDVTFEGDIDCEVERTIDWPV